MVICPNCQQELPDGLLFCTNCGSSLPPTSPPPTNMNPAALQSSSIISPPPPPQPEKKGLSKQQFTIIISFGAAAVIIFIVVIAIIIASSVGNKNTGVGSYTVPAAEQVEASSTTTAWLGRYFFKIPESYHFELGIDDRYEAMYLQVDGSYVTSTEILYAHDIDYADASKDTVFADYAAATAKEINASNVQTSTIAVNGVDYLYADFTTPNGHYLLALTPTNSGTSFVTTVVGGDDLTVGQRLITSAAVLSTAKAMSTSDKGVSTTTKDGYYIDTGMLLEDLVPEDDE